MKRSDALSPLSREHHVALEVALRLRRADASSAAAAHRAFSEFLATEGDAHFRAEEEILLPAATAALPADDPDVTRVPEEHAEIRRRAADLNAAAPPVEDLRALGDLLHDHVRHEERVLFPRIEAALDEQQLAELAARLLAAGDEHLPPRI